MSGVAVAVASADGRDLRSPKELMRKRLTMRAQGKDLSVQPQRIACVRAEPWRMTSLNAWGTIYRGAWGKICRGAWDKICLGAWGAIRRGAWRMTCFGTLAAVASAAASAAPVVSKQDMLWLDRVTYGPTAAVLDQYLKLGRRRFL